MITDKEMLEMNHDKLHHFLETIYLDWVNNFLTLDRFAAHYGITVDHAKLLIELGKKGSIYL